MTSWEATGPPGMDWVPPATVVTSVKPSKFCTTPPAISASAPSTDSGSSTRTVVRVRSTQKLPMVPLRRYAKPRTRATATAMPVAAETKFCTARPANCTVYARFSPEYACQLVLVTKEMAVLNATPGSGLSAPVENGSHFWVRCSRYSSSTPAREKYSTARRYACQDCSWSAATPVSL